MSEDKKDKVEDVNIEEIIVDNDIFDYERVINPTPDYEKELSIMSDKYLRVLAEFDNYKKRTIKERSEFSKSCNDSIINNLLKVVDDFERASEHEKLSDGVTLIYKSFVKILDDLNIKEMKCIGEKFNSDFMNGVANIETNLETGEVVDVLEKGYVQNNRVIRFANVVISK